MAEFISLEKALRIKLIRKGDLINPSGCFGNKINEIILGRHRTGLNYDQFFKREENLIWTYDLDLNGKPTLFSSQTEFDLILQGKAGCENVENLLNTMSSVYSSHEVGLNARALTKEDAEFFVCNKIALERFIKPNNKTVWLASSYVDPSSKHQDFGVYIMFDSGIGRYNLFYPYGYGSRVGYAACFAISLLNPEKLLVDIESMTRYGVWKLILSKEPT